MRRGDFAAAWEVSDRVLQERRGRTPWHLPRHEQWLWDGRPLSGGRVLVHCYHGLGDTLQFLRYMPLLERPILWVQAHLRSLIRYFDTPGSGQLLTLHDGDPGVERDADIEIMELPHAFRTTLETIPPLLPNDVRPRSIPFHDAGIQVGLVWSSGAWDPRRSIPVEALEPLREVKGVQWHLLQRGPAQRRPPSFGWDLSDDEPLCTAMTMKALDLVITVDSMPAHLAGSLGVPVWTLLPNPADWRWMEARADSPWYPTMRLFRQRHDGEWGPVVQEVAERLRWIVRLGFPGRQHL